ncbi:MAG: transglutaminase-like domain-containing protein [bacterium]
MGKICVVIILLAGISFSLEYKTKKREIIKNYIHNVLVYLEEEEENFSLCIPIPPEINGQKILRLKIKPMPDKELKIEGQRYILYRKRIKPHKEYIFTWKATIETQPMQFIMIDPKKVGRLNEIPLSIAHQFTISSDMYSMESEIVKMAAKEAVGNEKNPYLMIAKIDKYVRNNMRFLHDGMWDNAEVLLKKKMGSCSEYAILFSALCRLNRIPTRLVANTGHRWKQVYIPRYGWVTMESPGNGEIFTGGSLIIQMQGVRNEYLYDGWDYRSSFKLDKEWRGPTRWGNSYVIETIEEKD